MTVFRVENGGRALTLEAAARRLREATKNKEYRATPLGLEVARYIRWKRSEWGATESTVRDYEATLAKTALWFADLELRDFEPPIGQERLRECWDHYWGDKSARTRGKVLSIWTDFFDWACRERGMNGNPARVLSRPKRRDVKREVFSDAFVIRVLEAQTYKADRLGCELILKYALRRSEIAGVRFKDFDFERRRVLVTGKGGAVRYVPIIDDAFWRDLGALQLDVQAQPDHALLYSREGNNGAYGTEVKRNHAKPIKPRSVHTWWYRCLSEARVVGADKDGGDWHGQNMHRGRHTVATEILRKSGNIVAAQKMLGHKDVKTTVDAYAHFDDTDLARVLTEIRDAGTR